jgi:hypothetical protein
LRWAAGLFAVGAVLSGALLRSGPLEIDPDAAPALAHQRSRTGRGAALGLESCERRLPEDPLDKLTSSGFTPEPGRPAVQAVTYNFRSVGTLVESVGLTMDEQSGSCRAFKRLPDTVMDLIDRSDGVDGREQTSCVVQVD